MLLPECNTVSSNVIWTKPVQRNLAKLFHLMNGVEEGSICCYGICQNCQKKIHVIGIEKPLNKYRREIAIVI